jgi:hypothetical protein
MEYLLQKGAYINYINANGENVLIYLLEDIISDIDIDEDASEYIKRRIQTCKWLIRHGVKVKYKSSTFHGVALFGGWIVRATTYLGRIVKYDDEIRYLIVPNRRKSEVPGGGKRCSRKRRK